VEEGAELPRAYVVRRPGSDEREMTEGDVKAFVERGLAYYKRLEGGVRFVDAIPKNASGKVSRRRRRFSLSLSVSMPLLWDYESFVANEIVFLDLETHFKGGGRQGDEDGA